MKVDILAIGAHPDDVELSCAGTLAHEIAQGKTVVILDLTRGELGTRGSAEIRQKEATDAAEILGVAKRYNLDFADGFFQNDPEHQKKLIRYIRHLQPEIVLCNTTDDRHPDHGRAAALVVESCFLSGLRKIETSFEGKIQQHWRPKNIYHYIQWNSTSPDFVVDISAQMEVKLAAVQAYSSQFYKPDSGEPETPISTQNFLDSIKYRAADMGRIIGVDYAEGFTTNRFVGVNAISDLI
jgi:bacillithiol biosynthesis deacetylase BshB1